MVQGRRRIINPPPPPPPSPPPPSPPPLGLAPALSCRLSDCSEVSGASWRDRRHPVGSCGILEIYGRIQEYAIASGSMLEHPKAV